MLPSLAAAVKESHTPGTAIRGAKARVPLSECATRSRMRTRQTSALFALLGTAFLSLACGTDAVGVEACRKIEDARCTRFYGCELVADLAACQRFYHDQCLGGVPGKVTPNASQVNSCVAAINGDATCGVAKAPEKSNACAFLIPVPSAGAAGAGGTK